MSVDQTEAGKPATTAEPLALRLNDQLGRLVDAEMAAYQDAAYADHGSARNQLERFAAAVQAAERDRLKADAEAWGNALNEAGWAQLDSYRKRMRETEPPMFFNMGKSILRDSIAAYFNALMD